MAYLEHYPEPGGPAARVPVVRVPFVLGRAETVDHPIYSSKVSKEHASIVRTDAGLVVRDLDSTNGTFVNGQRVREQILRDGDILHLAHVEFCFRADAADTPRDGTPMAAVERTQALASLQPDSLIRSARLLRELIAAEAVRILFQPIVNLQTRAIVGYEALGRGAHPDLTCSPAPLLKLAEQCDLVLDLCRLFMRATLTSASRLPAGARIFINVHPRELAGPDFVSRLEQLRQEAPGDRPIVLEIAESSVTDVAQMRRYRDAFSSLGFEFAYDDFGAGQARLLELADIPPHYLKLDLGVVQGIDTARPRQDVVRALLHVVNGLGVHVIAEGIETDAVAATCLDVGCQFGQGYLFGRPRAH